jgi:hypothetical protein
MSVCVVDETSALHECGEVKINKNNAIETESIFLFIVDYKSIPIVFRLSG